MLAELKEGAWAEESIHDELIEVTRHQRLVSGTVKGSEIIIFGRRETTHIVVVWDRVQSSGKGTIQL